MLDGSLWSSFLIVSVFSMKREARLCAENEHGGGYTDFFCSEREKKKSEIVQSVSDSLQPNGLQQTRLPCRSPTPRACSSSCPSSQRCHPTISSSVTSFFSCLQSFPASVSFPMSKIFTLGGQRIGASASAWVLLMNIQGWFPSGLTDLIALQSRGLWRVFSNTTVWKHQFFSTQPYLWSASHICAWLLEKP